MVSLHVPLAIELILATNLVLGITSGRRYSPRLGGQSGHDRGVSGDNGCPGAPKGEQASSGSTTARQIHDEAKEGQFSSRVLCT